jgi:hypothetical protein
VLIAQSSIESKLSDRPREEKDVVRSKVWWQVLETTRHMLAHPSITDGPDLLKVILNNLRALLLIARVDITTHMKWKFLGDEMLVSLKRPDVNGKIWVDRIPTVLLASLHHPSYQELLDDFDSTEAGEHTTLLKACRQIFGHVAYRLKGCDDDAWKSAAVQFKYL